MKKLLMALCCVLFLFSFSSCSAADKRCECPCCTGELDLATYSISYYTNDGGLDSLNPVAYNSLTPSFTLSAPKRSGYRFLGWSRSEDLSAPILSLEVSKGTTGNLSFFAVWCKLITLSITTWADGLTVGPITPVLPGETVTFTVTPSTAVKGLRWSTFPHISAVSPDSCVYDEELSCYVVSWTIIENTSLLLEVEP